MSEKEGNKEESSLEDEIKEGKGMDGIPMVIWRYAGVKESITYNSRFGEKGTFPRTGNISG